MGYMTEHRAKHFVACQAAYLLLSTRLRFKKEINSVLILASVAFLLIRAIINKFYKKSTSSVLAMWIEFSGDIAMMGWNA